MAFAGGSHSSIFLSAHDGGVVGLPDHEVIAVAAESDRILVSHDRKTMPSHFARFRETRSSPGIIMGLRRQDRWRYRILLAATGTLTLNRSYSALSSQPNSAIAASMYIQISSAMLVPTLPYNTL